MIVVLFENRSLDNMWAITEKHPDIVKLLAARGADVNAQTAITVPKGEYVPARAGGASGSGIIRQRALPKADGGMTPLLFAVRDGNTDMSNGNQHDHDPLPIVVAGGASGQLKGDRHLVFPAHTPMSNLMLSLLDKLDVHQDSFGDSTGKLEI